MLHGWEGREELGGRVGETKGWEEDGSSAGEEREGEREETTAFSEGVAALRPGLRITLISCCFK